MSKLDEQASRTIKKLERYERRTYQIKVGLYLLIGAIIIAVNLYTSHQALSQIQKTHDLICSISKTVQIQTQEINNNCEMK